MHSSKVFRCVVVWFNMLEDNTFYLRVKSRNCVTLLGEPVMISFLCRGDFLLSCFIYPIIHD
jgi:hypothetical protein